MVFALVLLAPVGRAMAGDIEDAKAHYEKGVGFYALGKYAEAAIEYEKAFELKSDPALLYNAAQAHRLAGNKERALLLYQNYLRLFEKVPNRGEVQRHVAELKHAIETERRAQVSPPTHPISPSDEALRRAHASEPKPVEPVKPPVVEIAKPVVKPPTPPPPPPVEKPAPVARPELTAPPPVVVVNKPAPPPPRKKSRAWLWGVVAGAVVVVGVGVGLGVGLGARGGDPSPSIGQALVR